MRAMTITSNGTSNVPVREIEYPTISEREEEAGGKVNAWVAINSLLNGKPNPYMVSAALGRFGALYDAMVAAFDQDGLEGARQVFLLYANEDPEVAALRPTDPALAQRRSWSVSDLYETEFPEQKFTIPGILPAGLAALGARPKIGKSWMALQLSVAVGTGGTFFNEQAERGKVLYLAFEDSPRRMRNRLQKQGAPVGADVTFGFAWRPLIGGGTADLIAAIERDHYSLIVIDTLARALGFVDPNKQAEMNLHLGALQRIAVDQDITILLIDHHRKGNGGDGDVIDDLIGATSKSGVLDVAIGLYRSRGERSATFKLTGRDIEERELAIQFDRESGRWECLGDQEAVRNSAEDDAIVEAVGLLGAPTLREITDYTHMDRSKVYRRLQNLIFAKQIRQVDGSPTRYIVGGTDAETGDHDEEE